VCTYLLFVVDCFNKKSVVAIISLKRKIDLATKVKKKWWESKTIFYIRICKGVVLVSMYIFYLFDFFQFSVLEKREKIWHWDKAGFSL
jgi:ABC-type arginine/histidine transport system permease subunit